MEHTYVLGGVKMRMHFDGLALSTEFHLIWYLPANSAMPQLIERPGVWIREPVNLIWPDLRAVSDSNHNLRFSAGWRNKKIPFLFFSSLCTSDILYI